jgi:hypothetical protein
MSATTERSSKIEQVEIDKIYELQRPNTHISHVWKNRYVFVKQDKKFGICNLIYQYKEKWNW